MEMQILFNRIKDVYVRMSRAAMKADRSPDEVQLIAVTKTVEAGLIREAVACGLRVFGESKVQEAKNKITGGEVSAMSERLSWHLIGHLQKNKVRDAVQLFDLIHSVDSVELADEIDRQAERIEKVQRVLVQVKLSEEETKHGLAENVLFPVLERIRGKKHVTAEGLMTIPPFLDDLNSVRPYFIRLRELRDSAAAEGFSLPELSMGMSHDFEAAIEEGATMVRVGTAIFGERGLQ
ncbi:MAG: YggS family pyridoxal phosphate-dependent enzyme [Nitrospirae bacterium]|nr:YggS family pyridoxal phosphate-dependent enzyme [Nitrospirota bacterium]